jgi:hypothetical protein
VLSLWHTSREEKPKGRSSRLFIINLNKTWLKEQKFTIAKIAANGGVQVSNALNAKAKQLNANCRRPEAISILFQESTGRSPE